MATFAVPRINTQAPAPQPAPVEEDVESMSVYDRVLSLQSKAKKALISLGRTKLEEWQKGNETAALLLLQQKLQEMGEAVKKYEELNMKPDAKRDKEEALSGVEKSRRNLLAAARECSPNVIHSKPLMGEVEEFARMSEDEVVSPRHFGVSWKTSKAQAPPARAPFKDQSNNAAAAAKRLPFTGGANTTAANAGVKKASAAPAAAVKGKLSPVAGRTAGRLTGSLTQSAEDRFDVKAHQDTSLPPMQAEGSCSGDSSMCNMESVALVPTHTGGGMQGGHAVDVSDDDEVSSVHRETVTSRSPIAAPAPAPAPIVSKPQAGPLPTAAIPMPGNAYRSNVSTRAPPAAAPPPSAAAPQPNSVAARAGAIERTRSSLNDLPQSSTAAAAAAAAAAQAAALHDMQTQTTPPPQGPQSRIIQIDTSHNGSVTTGAAGNGNGGSSNNNNNNSATVNEKVARVQGILRSQDALGRVSASTLATVGPIDDLIVSHDHAGHWQSMEAARGAMNGGGGPGSVNGAGAFGPGNSMGGGAPGGYVYARGPHDGAMPYTTHSAPVGSASVYSHRRRRGVMGVLGGVVKTVVGVVGAAVVGGAVVLGATVAAAAANTHLTEREGGVPPIPTGRRARGGSAGGAAVAQSTDALLPKRALQQLRKNDLLALGRG